jgi:uncharacterized protein (TIGR02246 family)
MTNDQANEKIREVVATWMRATANGDLETVLTLIAEDAVFLLPGRPPMRGREAFAAALRSALGQVHIEGKPDIQEIHVAGNYAFCWNQLSLTLTPFQGGPAQRRAGPTLSVFRKRLNLLLIGSGWLDVTTTFQVMPRAIIIKPSTFLNLTRARSFLC